MELVVDANVLTAAILKNGLTRELLLDTRLKLCAPEHLLLEVQGVFKRDRSIQKRAGLEGKALQEVIYFLTQRIETHSENVFSSSIKEALTLAPHPEDAPYLALALRLSIPIWSNDLGIRAQKKVKVYSTKDLVKQLQAL